jgi:hypothetical protein
MPISDSLFLIFGMLKHKSKHLLVCYTQELQTSSFWEKDDLKDSIKKFKDIYNLKIYICSLQKATF